LLAEYDAKAIEILDALEKQLLPVSSTDFPVAGPLNITEKSAKTMQEADLLIKSKQMLADQKGAKYYDPTTEYLESYGERLAADPMRNPDPSLMNKNEWKSYQAKRKAKLETEPRQVITETTEETVSWNKVRRVLKEQETAGVDFANQGRTGTPQIENLRTKIAGDLRRLTDEHAQKMLDADKYKALKQANSEYRTYLTVENSIAEQQYAVAKSIGASRYANAALSTVGLLTGDVGSFKFNAIQYGVRAAFDNQRIPAVLYQGVQKARGVVTQEAAKETIERLAKSAKNIVTYGLRTGVEQGTARAVGAYVSSNESANQELRQLSKQLLQATGNVESYAKFVADNFSEYENSNPAFANTYMRSAAKVQEVIQREIPAEPLQQILDNPEDLPDVSDMDMEKMREVLTVLRNPVGVLESGEPTAKQLEILKEVYPSTLEKFVEPMLETLLEEKMKGRKFTSEEQARFSFLLGGGQSADDPKFVLRLQAKFKEQRQVAETPQPRQQSSSRPFSSVSNGMETASERVGKL
jgi:hypothetical protein